MPTLNIDGHTIDVEQGKTVLDAARKLGLRIPTLCFLDGCRAETSCMVCVVRINGQAKLTPSCAVRAVDGMIVESETAEVRAARRAALDLLLSEHAGDCEAPCQRACPAHMDIPRMIRQIASGRFPEALVTVKRDIALPAILGRICPAPCEKACRRSKYDSAVSICLLKRFVGDNDLAHENAWLPACLPASGKTVAIVGAGPTGLSAAYYLLQQGHACTLFDEHAEPGGMLRYGVQEDKLPRKTLDAELDVLQRLGATFRMNTALGRDLSLADAEVSFNAVVLGVGAVDATRGASFGLVMSDRGIHVAAHSFQTSREKVFAGGDAIQPTRLAIRAAAHGKAIALAVNRFVNGEPPRPPRHRFDSRVGVLRDGEMAEFLKEANPALRQEPLGNEGFSDEAAKGVARRCLHCDCRKSDACRLRDWADECGATQHRYPGIERKAIRLVMDHEDVVFDPGKCILCRLCVQATEKAGERLGLTVLGRGFDSRISVPFAASLTEAIEKTAARCVEVCPTGAISWKKQE